MNDKKRDLLIFLVAIILFDLLGWFVFKSNLISIFISNVIMGVVFFRSKNVYLRIALTVLVALLAYLVVFVFN
ncbi:MAG: hypothetical protein ACRCZN_00705 [Lactococcus lactis]